MVAGDCDDALRGASVLLKTAEKIRIQRIFSLADFSCNF